MVKKLTTWQISRMLGVSDQSVSNWVDSGQLHAGRTPGGHRRVERDDLIDFLKRQNLRIPPELLPAIPTILIVDDEPEVTRWMSTILAAQHPQCRILVAHDGFAAGEMVMAEHPDLVILDLYMPGIDGFEVCRRIKSDERTRGISVLAITAHPSEEAQRAILDAGAQAVMVKPIDAAEICSRVGDILQDKYPA
jgi:excisionase family DNA binding protein